MGKIFEADFRTGSYIDKVSGVVGVNTTGVLVRSEKGIAWESIITSNINYGNVDGKNLGTSDFLILQFYFDL